MTHKLAQFFVVLICSLTLASSATVRAAEISGVKLPDQVTVGGRSLKLNGAGLRQAKSIQMVFMRDVSAKQMSDAFGEGFEKNCIAGCAELKPHLAKLQGLLKDMKKGETMGYNFTGDGVEVMIRGQKVGKVGDKAFSHQLIRCWIGKNPPNTELKDGLLGVKK
jgi:hypothetical protein